MSSKTKFICFSLTTAAIALAAQAANADNGAFDGARVGGQLGAAVLNHKGDLEVERIRVPAVGATIGNHATYGGDRGYTQWSGTLSAGYGHSINNRFYLGIDGQWLIQNPRARNNLDYTATVPFGPPIGQEYHEISKIEVSTNGQYTITLQPGVLLTPRALLYGTVGYIGSDMTLVMHHDVRDFGPLNNDIQTRNSYLHGMQYGLGMSLYLFDNISLGLQFMLTFYNDRQTQLQYFKSSGFTQTVNSRFNFAAKSSLWVTTTKLVFIDWFN